MAKSTTQAALARLISDGEAAILADWVRTMSSDTRISAQEAQGQGKEFLHALGKALAEGNISDIRGPDFNEVRDILAGFSRSRALQGFSPSETAIFVFSLKQALFERVRTSVSDAKQLADSVWALNQLLDQLGLYTVESL